MSEISCSPPCQNMVPHPWQVGDVVFMCLQNYWALALHSPESTQPCPLSLPCSNATDRAGSGGGMAVLGLPPGSCKQGSKTMVVLRSLPGRWRCEWYWDRMRDVVVVLSVGPFLKKKKKKDHFKLQPLDLFQRKSTPLWWPWNYLTPPPLWESPDL